MTDEQIEENLPSEKNAAERKLSAIISNYFRFFSLVHTQLSTISIPNDKPFAPGSALHDGDDGEEQQWDKILLLRYKLFQFPTLSDCLKRMV